MTKDTTKAAAVAADICFSTTGLIRLRTAFAHACAASSKRCWRKNWTKPCRRPRYGRGRGERQ